MMCSCGNKLDAAIQQRDLRNSYQDFFDILREKKLTPLFQPIVDLSRRTIFGYESLIRGPSDSPYHSPVTLFDIAIRSGKLMELDLMCREAGISHFQNKQLPGKLFINATPESLLEPGHRSGLTLEILQKVGLAPENVVIEMTEQFPMENFDVMRNAMQHYKAMGFEIAIDDLGAGYSGLRRWSELQPDYVKIDRHFIQGIHEDQVKQSFVRSINDIAHGLGCKVIAEGIETQSEYRTLFSMGITLGQGYYFSRPKQVPPYVISNELFACSSLRDCSVRANKNAGNISALLVKVPTIKADTTLEDVHMIFHKKEDLTSVVVIDQDDIALGLIKRSSLLSTFSTKYGRSLYGHKSVLDFIDRSSVIVDSSTSFETVSKLVTENMHMNIADDFIITENGKYAGIGKVVQLLKIITEMQIKNARYANPLTLLPGNVPIYEKIDSLIESKNAFSIAYCDLDNFKPYNDVYGYAKGDQVIKTLADILLQHVVAESDFVGHVGGDDFIIVFESDDWAKRCEAILQSFEREIPHYYNELDKNNNGIQAHARNGESVFYPIMSLSIGVITPNLVSCRSYSDMAEVAARAKHNAKKMPGSSLFIERRAI